ncbi:WhiB family transcriptional regulator [Streptomyces sp. NPDC059680]|uniref:WhiB family transcriptional regulator n=1 Tax=Streptomyces sp. NPDC059680 TaxID=3346904 RepID=UPI0036B89756
MIRGFTPASGWCPHRRRGHRDLDTELFSPVSPKGPGQRRADEAKTAGKTCAVRRPCASRALATAHQYAIWGGMHEEELKRTVPKLPLPE